MSELYNNNTHATPDSKQEESKTIEDKLSELTNKLDLLKQQKPRKWKDRVKQEKECQHLQQWIEDLKAYKQLSLGDWVTDHKRIGKISMRFISPGGLPQVMVSWGFRDEVVPIPEQIKFLEKLEENWSDGFDVGDRIEEYTRSGTIVDFVWNGDKIMPVIQFDDGVERESYFHCLSLCEKSRSKENPSNPNGIILDPEFNSLIPPMSPMERSQLESNILEYGCRDPLVKWKGHNLLLDGYNRHAICTEHGIEFSTVEIELSDRDAAHDWLIENQLGRRNLTSEAMSYFRGKLHHSLKASVKNPFGRSGKKQNPEIKVQNEPKQNPEIKVQNEPKQNTAKDTASQLADQFKVNRSTIKRDAKFAIAVDKLAEVAGPEVRTSIFSRQAKLTKKGIFKLAKEAERHPDRVQRKFKDGKFDPVEDFIEKTSRPNPFQVGEVVEVIARKEPRLKSKRGYWAIVTAVNLDNTCDLKLWNGEIKGIFPINLKSLGYSSDKFKLMDNLCDRLSHIREIATEPMVHTNLQFLGSLKSSELTKEQETILNCLEQMYNICHEKRTHICCLFEDCPAESLTGQSYELTCEWTPPTSPSSNPVSDEHASVEEESSTSTSEKDEQLIAELPSTLQSLNTAEHQVTNPIEINNGQLAIGDIFHGSLEENRFKVVEIVSDEYIKGECILHQAFPEIVGEIFDFKVSECYKLNKDL